MRLAVVLLLGFAVFAAGCAHPVQAVRDTDRARFPARGVFEFSTGLTPKLSPVIWGLEDSRVLTGSASNVHIGYMFRGQVHGLTHYSVIRNSLEFRLQELILPLYRGGLHWGNVQILYAIPVYRLNLMPEEGDFFGAHFEIGGGGGLPFFVKSGDLKEWDAQNGIYTEIIPGEIGTFSLGLGADLYVSKGTCVTIDARGALGTGRFTWKENDVVVPGVEHYSVANVQFTVGIRFLF